MTAELTDLTTLEMTRELARTLRVDSLRATAAANAGHPTSAASAAELMAVLGARHFRLDVGDPAHPGNDRFILSKGHASALQYAWLKAFGAIDDEELLTYGAAGQPAGGSPASAPALGRGGDRLARPGHRLRGGHGPLPQAARAEPGAGVRAVRRQRDGRGLGLGGVRARCVLRPRQPGRHRGRELPSGSAAAPWWVTTRPFWPAGPRPSAGRRSRSTGTTCRTSTRAFRLAGVTGRPTAIIARTVKGKDLAGVEGREGWHGRPHPDPAAALAALGRAHRDAGSRRCLPRRSSHRAPPRDARSAGPATRSTSRSRPGWPTARRSSRSATPATTSSCWTPRPTTRRTPSCSPPPIRTATSRCSSPSNRWSRPPSAWAPGVGPSSHRPSRRSPRGPSSSSGWRRSAVLPLRICGSHAGLSVGESGASGMGLEDIACFRAIPGSHVLQPADATAAAALTALSADLPGFTLPAHDARAGARPLSGGHGVRRRRQPRAACLTRTTRSP